MSDNRKLNSLIDCSTNVDLKSEEEFWFSRPNQRKLTYLLARDLLLAENMHPEEAIEQAVDFHNAFYEKVLKFQKD